MTTRTFKFIANSTFQLVSSGPSTIILNNEIKSAELFIGTAEPAANNSNTFILKNVAGENFLSFDLATGDDMYIRSIGETSRVSVIETTS